MRCSVTEASLPSSYAGVNYLQSVTPQLAFGGEAFYLSQALKSGIGIAARHQGEKHVATAQVASTGLVSLNYAHRISDKVTLSIPDIAT